MDGTAPIETKRQRKYRLMKEQVAGLKTELARERQRLILVQDENKQLREWGDRLLNVVNAQRAKIAELDTACRALLLRWHAAEQRAEQLETVMPGITIRAHKPLPKEWVVEV